jgi:hypothetical protein
MFEYSLILNEYSIHLQNHVFAYGALHAFLWMSGMIHNVCGVMQKDAEYSRTLRILCILTHIHGMSVESYRRMQNILEP